VVVTVVPGVVVTVVARVVVCVAQGGAVGDGVVVTVVAGVVVTVVGAFVGPTVVQGLGGSALQHVALSHPPDNKNFSGQTLPVLLKPSPHL